MLYTYFINSSHPLWMNTLQKTPHDIYHLPGYLNLEAKRIQATPEAVVIQQGDKIFFLPYLLRKWARSDGLQLGLDVVSPYGYPGFSINSAAASSNEFVKLALSHLQQVWRERKLCSAFLRLHPVLNNNVEQYLADSPDLCANGKTLAIKLDFSVDELWKQTRNNHRRGINRLQNAGFYTEILPIQENIDSFISIYEETMDRVGAKQSYYFRREYFSDLIQIAGAQVYLWVAKLDRVITAVALITECNGIVQYHLGGTSNSFLKESPIKLIFNDVRTWAKERGNHLFHLGGGLGGNEDSLYNFKSGFANQSYTFFTLKTILNESQYNSWVESQSRKIYNTQDKLLSEGYFPAYRMNDLVGVTDSTSR